FGDGPDKGATADEPRKNDFVFRAPYRAETVWKVVPPPGFAVDALPPASTQRIGPVELTKQFSADAAGVVTATFRLDTGAPRLKPADFVAMRQSLRRLLDDKPMRVTWHQVALSHLAAGRIREAVDETGRLLALEPKRAQFHAL